MVVIAPARSVSFHARTHHICQRLFGDAVFGEIPFQHQIVKRRGKLANGRYRSENSDRNVFHFIVVFLERLPGEVCVGLMFSLAILFDLRIVTGIVNASHRKV